MEFDFQRYIQDKRRVGGGAPTDSTTAPYAFGRDARVLRTLERARPVKLALEASHKLDVERLRERILGGARRADDQHEPRLARRFEKLAASLSMSPPPLYLTDEAGDLGALALSIEREPFVLIDRSLLDTLEDDELSFVLGRLLGHIQNDHALFLTTAFALERFDDAFMGWIVKPARFAIGAWLKLGDLTADRAGMLACKDLHVAARALIKRRAPGALENPIDINNILDEAEENPRGSLMARLTERDPRLPGRLAAMKAFADSELFRRAQGREGGQSLTSVDRQVESIIKLW